MVEIQRVAKTFRTAGRNGTGEVKALADVSFSVRENEFISIIGPSGCGKTTLLKMIDGLIPYDSGNILIDGKQVIGAGAGSGRGISILCLVALADGAGQCRI